MLTPFSRRELSPIAEAYLGMLCESAEDKNRRRAVHLADQWLGERGLLGKVKTTTANGRELKDGEAVEHEAAKAVANARGMANAKYMPGAVRLYLELQEDPMSRNAAGSDLGRLNQIVKIIAGDPNHLNEYDGNLNGMSFKDIERRFATSVATAVKSDMEEIGSRSYSARADYDIVRIPDFKAAQRYGRYTSWCVTHGRDAWNSYTHDGTGIFYFCLRRGFRKIPKVIGNGCPLDDYGSSMIAISVNDDGSLNTCTCRWNHENGGNDQMMTTSEISNFLGVNFYDVFKPRSPEELMAEYEKNRLPDDDISRKIGAMKIEDSIRDVDVTEYVKVIDGKVRKYRLVGEGLIFDTFEQKFIKTGTDIDCSIFTEAFFNIPLRGHIEIPYGVKSIGGGAFSDCHGIESVTIPDTVTRISHEAFRMCNSLKSIVIPDSVVSIQTSAFWGCESLANIKIPNNLEYISDFTFTDCASLTDIEIPDSVVGIGKGAFYTCSSLTKVLIPSSVTDIKEEAFLKCYALKEVILPSRFKSDIDKIGLYDKVCRFY